MNKIKEIRKKLNLTQQEFAKKCGFQTSAVSHFEGGRREPSLKNLVKISRSLNISIDQIVFGESVDLRVAIKSLNNLIEIQCSHGNWNCNKYMHGMANGLLVAMSILDGKSPEFLDAPKKWLDDIKMPKNWKPTATTNRMDND